VVETKENGGVGELEGGNGKGNTSVHRQNGPIGEADEDELHPEIVEQMDMDDIDSGPH
jgi:hypothetical protein